MSGDVKVLGLVGSLRRGSVNLQLLDAVRTGPPNGLVIDRFDRLKDIPPFDEDDEDAVPNVVDELRARIRAAPAVLIATPEYNGSIPGQLKNAIDWASRPFATSALRGKHVAVIGTSPSPGGARTAIADARRILSRAGASVIDETASFPRVFTHLDRAGNLDTAQVSARIAPVIAAVLAVIRPAVDERGDNDRLTTAGRLS